MPDEKLMAAFVGDDGFKGKIFRVGVALERFCVDREQIIFGRNALAVLCASGLAVNVTILDAADETEPPGDASRPIAGPRRSAAVKGPGDEVVIRASYLRCVPIAHATAAERSHAHAKNFRSPHGGELVGTVPCA
jgi:hypothetical protein